MDRQTRHLRVQQLSLQLDSLLAIRTLPLPGTGWIRTFRKTLGISQEQLGKKMGVSKQSINQLEQNESDGLVRISSLKAAAEAMDLELCYFLVPKEATLEELIRSKARAWAEEVVGRSHQTMVLEEQSLELARRDAAVEALVDELAYTMPKFLWDR
jgi:predicted DNA-binding mobile mystery protein A